MKGKNRALAAVLVACLSLQLILMAASGTLAAAETGDTAFADGRIVFTGAHLQEGADGGVQALVDVSLRGIDASGVAFILEYDRNYLEVSDFTTNEECAPKTTWESYFRTDSDYEPNTFKGGTYDVELGEQGKELFGQVDEPASPDRGVVSLALFPQKAGDQYPDLDNSPYIKLLTDHRLNQYVLDAADRTIPLGQLSFRLKDPQAMPALTQGQLADLLSVHITSVSIGGTLSDLEYALLFYYNDFGDDREWMGKEYALFDLKFEKTLISVKTDPYQTAVQANDLYDAAKTASSTDLEEWLNANKNQVVLRYSDDTLSYDTVSWGGTDFVVTKLDDVTGVPTGDPYDPKSGCYLARQPYLDTGIQAQAQVTVTPVSVKTLSVEDREITYTMTPIDERPQTYAGLGLPEEGRPVLSVPIPGLTLPNVVIPGDAWTPDTLPAEFTTPTAGLTEDQIMALYTTHKFTTDVDTAAAATAQTPDGSTAPLGVRYPWLTTAVVNIEAIRRIGEKTENVDSAHGEVDGPSGAMTITVDRDPAFINLPERQATDGEGNPLYGEDSTPVMLPAEQTSFVVRLPDGREIDPAWFDPGKFSVQFVLVPDDAAGEYTRAVLTLDPSGSDPALEDVRRYFNLGGDFSIAARDPGSPEKGLSDFIPFTTAPRENVYLPPEGHDGSDPADYTFTYRGDDRSRFPVCEGDTLAKTVLLPGDDHIRLRYDPRTGAEPGRASEFTVVEWTPSPLAAGEVECVGLLTSHTYLDMGQVLGTVDNPPTAQSPAAPSVRVRLLLDVLSGEEEPEPEERLLIEPEDDPFVFDTVFYNDGTYQTQQQVFTVTNIGRIAVYGLRLTLGSRFDEAFVYERAPASVLMPGESTTFVISTKAGCEVAKYASSVQLSTNRNDTLATVHIEFEVSAFEVYRVHILSSNDQWGTARILGSQTYPASSAGADVTVQLRTVAGKKYQLSPAPEGLMEIISDTDFTPYTPGAVTITRQPQAADGSVSASFSMPTQGREIWILATFEENLQTRLGLEDLWALDHDEPHTRHARQAWNETLGRFENIQDFDADLDHYRVLLPTDQSSELDLELTLRNAQIAAAGDIQVTVDKFFVAADGTETADSFLPMAAAGGDPKVYTSAASEPITTQMPDFQRMKINIAYLPAGSLQVQEQRTYILDLCRVIAPQATLAYGNSPYGRIMADTAIDSANKASAKSAFVNADEASGKLAFTFPDQTTLLAPTGADPSIIYTPEAWGGGFEGTGVTTPVSPQDLTLDESGAYQLAGGEYVNFDMDDTALFVYNGEAFADPGVEFVDALGLPVEQEDITVSLAVRTLSGDPLAAEYDLAADFAAAAASSGQTVTGALAAGGVGTAFAELRVLPGVYRLEYQYEDAALGTTQTVFRNLIVLAAAADVDVSGTVDEGDVTLLTLRLRTPLPYVLSGYSDRLVYEYRICDATSDRNINNLDVNAAREGAGREFYPHP